VNVGKKKTHTAGIVKLALVLENLTTTTVLLREGNSETEGGKFNSKGLNGVVSQQRIFMGQRQGKQ